jgi:chemotaxis-related protein WspB
MDVSTIIEIVPIVDITPIPYSADYILGVINYRSIMVPIIDLSILISGKPSSRHLSSRIIILNYTDGNLNEKKIGLLAEKVTETISVGENDVLPTAFDISDTKFIKDFITKSGMTIQQVRLNKLLPDTFDFNSKLLGV